MLTFSYKIFSLNLCLFLSFYSWDASAELKLDGIKNLKKCDSSSVNFKNYFLKYIYPTKSSVEKKMTTKEMSSSLFATYDTTMELTKYSVQVGPKVKTPSQVQLAFEHKDGTLKFSEIYSLKESNMNASEYFLEGFKLADSILTPKENPGTLYLVVYFGQKPFCYNTQEFVIVNDY